MHSEIIISGFGGQGVLFAGQVLAYAALDAGLHVTWIPSYGPEMRGGTAHCTVIISSDEIGSPLVRHPSAVLALNQPSFAKYEPLVAHNGVLVVNASLMTPVTTRSDMRLIAVSANTLAEELGNAKLANIVMVGALLPTLEALPLEIVEQALASHLPERHRHLLPANYEALRRGMALGEVVLA